MSKAAPRRNVTFELPKAEFQALQDDAATRGLDSYHQRAKEIVLDGLSNQGFFELSESFASVDREVASLEARIGSLESEVSYLGELIRRLNYNVMTLAGKSSDEANKWIIKFMPVRKSPD